MKRLEIDRAKAASAHLFRPRFCETDLMGIVHHATYLVYFEMGRVDWLRKRGVTYADWAARGLHLPVVDLDVRYRAPAKFDEELELVTSLSELKSHSLRYEYRLTRGTVELATGSTRLACVNHDQKLTRFTDEMVHVLLSSEVA